MQNSILHKNFDTMYTLCVHQLDTFTKARVDNVSSCALPLSFDFDGLRTWILRRKLPLELELKPGAMPFTESPIICQVIGQISATKPVKHRQTHTILGGSIYTTTFWIESRPDTASRAIWSRIPDALRAISEVTYPNPLDISEIYEQDERTGKVSLLVQWTSDCHAPFSVSDPLDKVLAFHHSESDSRKVLSQTQD